MAFVAVRKRAAVVVFGGDVRMRAVRRAHEFWSGAGGSFGAGDPYATRGIGVVGSVRGVAAKVLRAVERSRAIARQKDAALGDRVRLLIGEPGAGILIGAVERGRDLSPRAVRADAARHARGAARMPGVGAVERLAGAGVTAHEAVVTGVRVRRRATADTQAAAAVALAVGAGAAVRIELAGEMGIDAATRRKALRFERVRSDVAGLAMRAIGVTHAAGPIAVLVDGVPPAGAGDDAHGHRQAEPARPPPPHESIDGAKRVPAVARVRLRLAADK